jgi:hypothetical protein
MEQGQTVPQHLCEHSSESSSLEELDELEGWEEDATDDDSRSVFCVLAVHVAGSDYAALHVKDDIGLDRAYRRVILGKRMDDRFTEKYCDGQTGIEIDHTLYEFTTAKDRREALEMARTTMQDNVDYDSSKHRFTHFRALSVAGTETYLKDHIW